MTKGDFSPVSAEEGAEKPKKGLDLRSILLIVAIIVVVVIIIAIIIGVVVYVQADDDSSKGQGMTYEPDIDGALIFEQGSPGNVSPSPPDQYIKKLRLLLEGYANENQEGEDVVECRDHTPPPAGKHCSFDRSYLGTECMWQNSFGYTEGQPCIFLSLDKKEGWIPDVSTNTTMPPDVRARYETGYIPVSCKGVNEGDVENLGDVQYWPQAGFPVEFFPYMGQENYIKPLVAVQFESAQTGVTIEIKCKVWIGNLVASTSFELLVD